MNWSDSISVSVATTSSSVIDLEQFGTTNDYLITYRSVLPSITSSISDTTLYTFIKFSSASDQIEGSFTDTLVNYTLKTTNYNDTSVYIFEDHYYLYNGFVYPTNTLEIGSDLVMYQLAPMDSIEKSYLATNYYMISDTFYAFQEVADFEVAIGSFLPNGSDYNEFNYDLNSTESFRYIDFYAPVGKDSVMLFYQGSNTGSNVNTWNFFLYDFELNILNSYQDNSISVYDNLWGETLYYDRLNGQGVNVFQNNIYILAHLPGSDSTKIFVYDMNFDLVCDIDIIGSGNEYGRIEIINDRLYYSRKSENVRSFFEIGACDFTMTVNDSNPTETPIFPNPANSYIVIQLPESAPSRITFYDMLGNTCLTLDTNSNQLTVDVTSLSSGIYSVNIIQGQNQSNQLLIIE